MNWFKDIIKAINKRKLIYFLLIIQLIISFTTAYKGIESWNLYTQNKKRLESFRDIENTYTVKIFYAEEVVGKVIKNGFDFSQEIKDKTQYKVIPINIRGDIRDQIWIETDYTILDAFKFKFTEGSIMPTEDIPQVIAGYNFKGKYKLGDKVKCNFLSQECQIVGFLEENHPSFWGFDFNNFLLVLNNEVSKAGNNCWVISNDGHRNTKRKLAEIFSSYGTIYVDPISKEWNENQKSSLIEAKNISMYALAMSIFSMGVFTSLMILIINEGKRDIGIKLACGAKRIKIYMNMVSQMIFIDILASIITIIIQYIKLNNPFNKNTFFQNISINYLIIMNVTVLIIIFLTSIPIFIKVMKLKPAELIKNE